GDDVGEADRAPDRDPDIVRGAPRTADRHNVPADFAAAEYEMDDDRADREGDQTERQAQDGAVAEVGPEIGINKTGRDVDGVVQQSRVYERGAYDRRRHT